MPLVSCFLALSCCLKPSLLSLTSSLCLPSLSLTLQPLPFPLFVLTHDSSLQPALLHAPFLSFLCLFYFSLIPSFLYFVLLFPSPPQFLSVPQKLRPRFRYEVPIEDGKVFPNTALWLWLTHRWKGWGWKFICAVVCVYWRINGPSLAFFVQYAYVCKCRWTMWMCPVGCVKRVLVT